MISNLCKILNNTFKREMLVRIYTSPGGVNVGEIAEEMKARGLVLSGVSQYLKQLEGLGVIMRSRSGRYVNYSPNPKNASPDVREVVEALVKRLRKGDDSSLDAVFAALMNPFRAKVIAALAKAGSISAMDICEATEHIPRYLTRDLQPAVDAGLIWSDDSETALATYHFTPPTDPFVKLLVSFL